MSLHREKKKTLLTIKHTSDHVLENQNDINTAFLTKFMKGNVWEFGIFGITKNFG